MSKLLTPGTTHIIKPEFLASSMYEYLMIKDGRKKALIVLGWISIHIADDIIDKYYDAVKPEQAELKIGVLSVGDKFYVCRTKEKGVVTGAAAGGRVPVNMYQSLRDFTPSCGHTFNIQTRVKFLWTY